MDYIIRPMERSFALEITTWKYPQPYSIYSMEADDDSIKELLAGAFYTATYGDELVGYFCYGTSAQVPWAAKNRYYPPGFTDIGLALRPDSTGRGLGLSFLKAGLTHAQSLYPGQPIRLTVAAFNQRAQKVYQRAGFKTTGSFTVPGGREFLIMIQG